MLPASIGDIVSYLLGFKRFHIFRTVSLRQLHCIHGLLQCPAHTAHQIPDRADCTFDTSPNTSLFKALLHTAFLKAMAQIIHLLQPPFQCFRHRNIKILLQYTFLLGNAVLSREQYSQHLQHAVIVSPSGLSKPTSTADSES